MNEKFPLEPKIPAKENQCPLPGYDCACRGDWCRLRQRNLSGTPTVENDEKWLNVHTSGKIEEF